MVNHTAIHQDAEIFDDECPDTDYGNHTDHQQDGEFEWSTSKQGWILSSFFYGYVLTQVNNQPANSAIQCLCRSSADDLPKNRHSS
jgi:hypothetical protein